MKASSYFVLLIALAGAVAAISGCGTTGPAPIGVSNPPQPTATPAARWLYVDHSGTFFAYALPLTAQSRPVRTLQEWAGLGFAPQIGVSPYGDVALASPKTIRVFHPPIVSFASSQAELHIPLTPAITEIGQSGADLVDIEYDPNANLWLLNNLGGEVSELQAPLRENAVAAVTIQFGAPGSKTAGFSNLTQARFDVNAALYVYASNGTRARVFKTGFPYAKPPGSIGLNILQSDFIDSSQWPPSAPLQPSLLLGQYYGPLRSPKPGSPPSPPVDVMSQFNEPLNQQNRGLFPNEHTDTIVGALTADPPRGAFYTLDAADGRLNVYTLPMRSRATPTISLRCLAQGGNCSHKIEHLFLAP
ncbi:MAG: hypothetical protein JO347_06110 [Candidatus Eremiobacteraeota bacterium]|nr:hypothetical protein [Candidatus Eremiobacteraeota bacterium]